MRDDVIGTLRAWLISQNPAAAEREFSADTNLIETGILESLQLVEFIMLIELESGRKILSEHIDGRWLQSLGSIYEHFFKEGEA